MAYYNDEENEEGQVEGTGVTTGPEAAMVNAGTAGASASGPAGKAGSFVGISDYLNANKPQSEKLANQVVGNIDQKAQAAESSLGGLQSSFNQAAEAQKVEADDDLLGKVKTNAVDVAKDEGLSGSFAKQRDASYKGPQALEEVDSGQAWSGLQSALQKAKGAKEAVKSEEGRMGLIKEISNNPRQSQGALVFDNMLLQSNPNAASRLQGAGANLNDFDARLGGAQQSAAQKAAELKALNEGTSQKAKGALNEGWQGLQAALQGRVSAADQAQQQEFDALRSKLASGYLSDPTLELLGLPSRDFTKGLDLSQFVERADTADERTLASEEDYARQAALMQLAGEQGGFSPILNETTDRELMGKVGPGYNLQSGGIQSAVRDNEAKYNRQADSLLDIGIKNPETAAWAAKAMKFAAGLGPSPGSSDDYNLAEFVEDNKATVQKLRELAQSYGLRTNSGNELGRVTSSRSVM